MKFFLKKLRFCEGIKKDIKNRLPYYWSDWKDGYDYRVVPATIFTFFTNVLPALAFSLDLYDRTEHAFGVNEVLLSSGIAAVIFSCFAGQPLCIVGVTGPISVFNYTVYKIITPRNIPFYPFMAWICLWSMVMHFIIAAFNGVYALKYITRFSCDVFGFYNAILYIQKGIQIITSQFNKGATQPEGFISVITAILVCAVGFTGTLIGENSPLLTRLARRFISDYSTPLSIVFFSGFVHIGMMRNFHLTTLPVTKSFYPTLYTQMRDPLEWHHKYHRGAVWFVRFWEIKVAYVFLAIPFAILLTILFYFDHNVSSLIAQDSHFKLKKPASFHWDFFILGITTGLSGVLGIPAPNGLIPQAPLHTESLTTTKIIKKTLLSSHSSSFVSNSLDSKNSENYLNSPFLSNRRNSFTSTQSAPLPLSTEKNTSSENHFSSTLTFLNHNKKMNEKTESFNKFSVDNKKTIGSNQENCNSKRNLMHEKISCNKPNAISSAVELNNGNESADEKEPLPALPSFNTTIITGVVEQRISNLAQGLLTFGCMTRPLLVVIGVIPQAVISGLFWSMASKALMGNGVVAKLWVFASDPALKPADHPLNKVSWRTQLVFIFLELASFAATFAITCTIAAIGFPIILLGFAAMAAFLFPRWFKPEILKLLDGLTASEFTMKSVLMLPYRLAFDEESVKELE